MTSDTKLAKAWICKTCLIQIDGNDWKRLQQHKHHDIAEDNMTPDEVLQFLKDLELRKERNFTSEQEDMSLDAYQSKLARELQHLKKITEAHFPDRFLALEACLAVKAQQMIEGVTQVFPLILIGPPSSYKSTVLEIVSVLPDCYVSDSFTPRSFVSHSANTKKEDLEKIDLLPRIRHKTLITPELAPLFSGNQELLLENFGILTRVLDGRGYQSDSGVHGQRGYTGDYSFTWLGAVVDIPHRVWKVFGNLGPRFYFYRSPPDPKDKDTKKEAIKQSLLENNYQFKVQSCKNATTKFWFILKQRPDQSEKKIVWDTELDDKETFDKIIDLAIVLSQLRASIPTWHTADTDSSGSNYHYEMPVIEEPQRASSALYNLARGHAVLHGRNYITKDDLSVVISVTLSSASRERVELFRLLIENRGKINTEQFQQATKVSKPTALKEMQVLCILGFTEGYEEKGSTKPIHAIKLKDHYDWFLSDEFKKYWREYKSSRTSEISLLSQTPIQENKEKVVPRDNENSFICKTRDAGPFGINERSQSSGSILKFHQNINHTIKFGGSSHD